MTTAPWGTTRMAPYAPSTPVPQFIPVIGPETQIAVLVNEHGRTVGEEAREFCARQSDGAVYKPLWDSRYRDAGGSARQVWVGRWTRPRSPTPCPSARTSSGPGCRRRSTSP
ncbi:putative ATP-grasp-modified RiPP [Kitasatospora sp. NA04385]|uniref:putative ATP-grasp-modified RiPP n=1 Tax=Kitasatospora sp. NA04385 TaxID=2742135 RepID=UPI0034CFB8C2